ncbi:MAG: TldD/PmbA family protein [Betaproteobacteria bacterium]|nr:TldD/PmbA family protein [Betaproteobacteria bacterium]
MLHTDEIKTLLSKIQSARPGIELDLSGSSVADQTVKVKESNTLDQSASQRTGVTLRVWNSDKRIGVVQLTSLDFNELLAAVDVALEAAPLGPSEDLPRLPLAADAGDVNSSASARSGATAQPASIEKMAEKLKTAVEQLKKFHPDIQGVPYNALTQRAVERFYANTRGLMRTQASSVVSTYLYAVGQAQGKSSRAAGHWGEEDAFEKLKMDDVVQVAGETLVAHLHPIKIPSGQYPVIFSGQAFLDLLGAFGNLFSAQNILDKQSLHTRESLGQTMASELLSLSDDPFHEWSVAPALFDGEGTAVRKTALVEKGVLKGLWHHSVTARSFGTQSTGHARVGAKMTVGSWFYNVAAGNGLGSIAENCIWVDDVEALHAGVNALQGSFSLPFKGFRIENGKKSSLEGVTVAGDILTLLKSIVAIDKKQERTSAGVCPPVAVSSLSITCEG